MTKSLEVPWTTPKYDDPSYQENLRIVREDLPDVPLYIPPAKEAKGTALSLADIIRNSAENPREPVIDGLLNVGEIIGIHGMPEVFKTFFSLQVAESICTGKPLLGRWTVPQPHSVYFLETEMSVTALGERLRKMFAGRSLPDNLFFASDLQLKRFRRAGNLARKFALVGEWLNAQPADILVADTANVFFRGAEKPNDETSVGAFFDLLAGLPLLAKLFVRHNHRRRMEDSDGDPASRIRGSGQFIDVPDTLVEIRRKDKRTNQAELSVTKLRDGAKPPDLPLWFDASVCRLIPGSPLDELLRDGRKTREELLDSLQARFDISPRMGDSMLKSHEALKASQDGHKRVFEPQGGQGD